MGNAPMHTNAMSRFVLLGQPVAHSLSPAFQSAALVHCGLDAGFDALDADADRMRTAAADVRAGRILGANITAPHKRLALELADEADAVATSIGAANTWFRSPEGLLVAANTDVPGLAPSLDQLLRADAETAVVLGAGGAAAAAAFALSHRVERVVLVNRGSARAFELASELATCAAAGPALMAVSLWPERTGDDAWTELSEVMAGAALVVNATSASSDTSQGRFAHVPLASLHPTASALDLCYAPGPTPFLRAVEQHVDRSLDGAGMLLEQGALAFALWTGLVPPRDVMRRALAVALGRDPASMP